MSVSNFPELSATDRLKKMLVFCEKWRVLLERATAEDANELRVTVNNLWDSTVTVWSAGALGDRAYRCVDTADPGSVLSRASSHDESCRLVLQAVSGQMERAGRAAGQRFRRFMQRLNAAFSGDHRPPPESGLAGMFAPVGGLGLAGLPNDVFIGSNDWRRQHGGSAHGVQSAGTGVVAPHPGPGQALEVQVEAGDPDVHGPVAVAVRGDAPFARVAVAYLGRYHHGRAELVPFATVFPRRTGGAASPADGGGQPPPSNHSR